jgi:AraC-like DNA-binding protein
MRDRTLSLSKVGLACGFVEQSHFTRVFTRMIGNSPSAWRSARVILGLTHKGHLIAVLDGSPSA